MTLLARPVAGPPASAPVPVLPEWPAPLAEVHLTGEHDLSTAEDVAISLANAIADQESVVVVGLAGVTFMDASTITVLHRAHQYLAVRGRRLEVARPSPIARRLLGLCGLSSWICSDPPAGDPSAS